MWARCDPFAKKRAVLEPPLLPFRSFVGECVRVLMLVSEVKSPIIKIASWSDHLEELADPYSGAPRGTNQNVGAVARTALSSSYTHRNSKFRLSENILGPSLKVAHSANPRNTPVLLAVGLNNNFQI